MTDVLRAPAQMMLNGLDRLNPATRRGKLQLLGWRGMRALLLRFTDPRVVYAFERQRLHLPFSHDLPIIRRQWPHYMTNVARVAHTIATAYPEGTGIDIGANVGDTILAIRSVSAMPLLGIEGNPLYYEFLRDNVGTLRDVELTQTFVGSGIATLSGTLRTDHGTASYAPSEDHSIEQKTLQEILRSHPRFMNARFLKVDTDGLDCIILRAAMTWLASARPVIYFEYDPSAFARYDPAGFEIFGELGKVGYMGGLIWDNRGDYLLSCRLSDRRLLEDMHQYFSGRQSKVYCDIAVFHATDRDMMETVRAAEVAFFANARRAQ